MNDQITETQRRVARMTPKEQLEYLENLEREQIDLMKQRQRAPGHWHAGSRAEARRLQAQLTGARQAIAGQ
jgi:hypothetical protein